MACCDASARRVPSAKRAESASVCSETTSESRPNSVTNHGTPAAGTQISTSMPSLDGSSWVSGPEPRARSSKMCRRRLARSSTDRAIVWSTLGSEVENDAASVHPFAARVVGDGVGSEQVVAQPRRMLRRLAVDFGDPQQAGVPRRERRELDAERDAAVGILRRRIVAVHDEIECPRERFVASNGSSASRSLRPTSFAASLAGRADGPSCRTGRRSRSPH